MDMNYPKKDLAAESELTKMQKHLVLEVVCDRIQICSIKFSRTSIVSLYYTKIITLVN